MARCRNSGLGYGLCKRRRPKHTQYRDLQLTVDFYRGLRSINKANYIRLPNHGTDMVGSPITPLTNQSWPWFAKRSDRSFGVYRNNTNLRQFVSVGEKYKHVARGHKCPAWYRFDRRIVDPKDNPWPGRSWPRSLAHR
jgi:hypothetical protein